MNQDTVKYDLYGKTIPLLFLGIFQAWFWLPRLNPQPWVPPAPFVFSHEWIAWCSRIDLGTATDFIPAVAMFLAGFLTALAGIGQREKNRFVGISILFQMLAITTVVVMDVAVPIFAHIVVCGTFVSGP